MLLLVASEFVCSCRHNAHALLVLVLRVFASRAPESVMLLLVGSK